VGKHLTQNEIKNPVLIRKNAKGLVRGALRGERREDLVGSHPEGERDSRLGAAYAKSDQIASITFHAPRGGRKAQKGIEIQEQVGQTS